MDHEWNVSIVAFVGTTIQSDVITTGSLIISLWVARPRFVVQH